MEGKKVKTPIDFIVIFKKLWPHRKTYYKVLPATLIITYLIMVCIPRYYRCSVDLAPEPTGTSLPSSLNSLAASIGVGSLSKLGSSDAINVIIYPNILKSKDFIAELMMVEVPYKNGKFKDSYYTYLLEDQEAAWWDVAKKRLSDWIKPRPKETFSGKEKLDVFNLTKQQSDLFENVSKIIRCNVDMKSGIVTITVQDQDPLVCATMANATCKKLQEFIVNYRTNKARVDYEYYKKLATENKSAYFKVRQQYISFADAHKDVNLASYKAKEEDLEKEMQLKYNVYTAITTQMQAAAAKLQEATPAFTVIQSASVPVRPAGPKRTLVALAMTILAFFCLSAWLLIKSDYINGKKL